MSFFQGRISTLRFQVTGAAPELFGPDVLDLLRKNAIGTQKMASADGIESGWTAGVLGQMQAWLGRGAVREAA